MDIECPFELHGFRAVSPGQKIIGRVSCMHIYALWHMTFGLFKHVVSYCIRRPFVDQITLEEGPLLSIRLLW